MDKYLHARIEETAQRTSTNNYVCATPFLDLPTRIELTRMAKGETLFGVPFLFIGGGEDNERTRLIFLPDYLQPNDIDVSECIHRFRVLPRSGKFSIKLTHRDYLGAILGTGIKREMIGDVLVKDNICEFFALPEALPLLEEGFSQVKSEEISLIPITLSEEGIRPDFKKETLFVPSLRLDAILAHGFPLSRGKAGLFIEEGLVTHNGEKAIHKDAEVEIGDLISVYRHGKIQVLANLGISKKNHLILKIKRYG